MGHDPKADKGAIVVGETPLHFARVTAPGLTEQESPRQCFAALFDVIGFRALRESLGGTHHLYQLFSRSILPGVLHSAAGRGRTVLVEGELQYWPDNTMPLVEHRVFSDSVLFLTPSDTARDFGRVLVASLLLLRGGFAGSKAPFRGAIGHGDVIADQQNGILVGTAIEDAYESGHAQVWAGCRLTEACSNAVARARQDLARGGLDLDEALGLSSVLVEYDVPVRERKPGGDVYRTENGLVLDWTGGIYADAASQSFNPHRNDHERRIAENTQAFQEWATQRRGHARSERPVP